jgi:hypothetical protein
MQTQYKAQFCKSKNVAARKFTNKKKFPSKREAIIGNTRRIHSDLNSQLFQHKFVDTAITGFALQLIPVFFQ